MIISKKHRLIAAKETILNTYDIISQELFVCFVALRPKSTAMVMAGRVSQELCQAEVDIVKIK